MPIIMLFSCFLPFPTPLLSPLRGWQQTSRSHQALLAGNLLPFGLNSITLPVPYSIYKQEVQTSLLREDVVKMLHTLLRIKNNSEYSLTPVLVLMSLGFQIDSLHLIGIVFLQNRKYSHNYHISVISQPVKTRKTMHH